MNEEQRVAKALADWYERVGRDDELTPEELIGEHPELDEELREHFEAMDLIGRVFTPPPDLPEGAPHRVGDFRVLREIGRGGMGVVYEAEQSSMGRRVALKVLSPSVTSTKQAVRRFRREARAAGQLHHTSIVPVHAMGEDQGLFYYAMELVEGPPLDEVVELMREPKEGSRPSGKAAENLLRTTPRERSHFTRLGEMMAGVADALQTAHSVGIIHRDVKPANLLLHADGTLKLVDFGLARLAGEGGSMTITGQIIGTPFYMSPEQAMARKAGVDHRSDIYSLGATLYEILTLRPPFTGDSIQEVCSKIITREPTSPRKVDPRVPRDLETIVQKAMEKEPERRYQTAEEMARDLRRFAEGMPIRARRIGPVGRAWRKVKRNRVRAALVAAVILLAAAGAFLGLRASEEAERRRIVEYDRFLADAGDRMAETAASLREKAANRSLPSGESARELYSRAIEVDPERPEAYWLRALSPGGSLEERLTDIAAAEARGLPEDTGRVLQTFLIAVFGREEGRSLSEAPKSDAEDDSPLVQYARARLDILRWRISAAKARLDRVIEHPATGRPLRYLALRQRALIRYGAQDWAGALDDLHALKNLGDRRLRTRIRTAAVWRRLGGEDTAETLFHELLEDARSGGTPDAWAELAKGCSRLGEAEWVERAAEEGLDAHPLDPHLLYARAAVRHRRGDLDGALDLLRRAIEIDEGPHRHCYLRHRARVLEQLGRVKEALEDFDEAIKLKPDCYLCVYSHGLFLIRTGRWQPALDEFDRVLELDAVAPPSAHNNRAMVLAMLGRHEEALAAVERSLSLCREYAGTYGVKGVVLCETGDYEGALDALRREAELDPNSAHAHAGTGRVLTRMGRYPEALEACARGIQLDPSSASAFSDLGIAFLRLGACHEALPAFEGALVLEPGRPQSHSNLGEALMGLGRNLEALQAFERAMELEPELAIAIANRGSILNRFGCYQEALAAHRRAAELEPEKAIHHFNRAVVLQNMEQYVEALRVCGRAIELDPKLARAHAMRGKILSAAFGRHGPSLKAIDRALEIEPDNPEYWSDRGLTLNMLGEFGEAVKAFQKAVELAPDRAEHHMLLGQALDRTGLPLQALAALRRALELDPECADAHYSLSVALSRQGNQKEALRHLGEVVRIDPCHANAHLNRGAILHNYFARDREALESFDEALRLGQRHPSLLQNRGIVLQALGRYEEALASYCQYLKLSPRSAALLWQIATSLLALGRPADAWEVAEEIELLDPFRGARARVECLRHMGRMDEAREVARKFVTEVQEHRYSLSLAWICAVAGEADRAVAILEQPRTTLLPADKYGIAQVYALVEKPEDAVAWLERAFEAGYRVAANAPRDPDFTSLEQDPEYEALLEKLRGK